jgi:hypothetical protein
VIDLKIPGGYTAMSNTQLDRREAADQISEYQIDHNGCFRCFRDQNKPHTRANAEGQELGFL